MGRFSCLLFGLLCLSASFPSQEHINLFQHRPTPLLALLCFPLFSHWTVGVYTSGFHHAAVALSSHRSLPPVGCLSFLFSFFCLSPPSLVCLVSKAPFHSASQLIGTSPEGPNNPESSLSSFNFAFLSSFLRTGK